MWERAALFGFIADAPALLPQEAQRALWYRLASEHSGLLASECAGAVALIEEAWLLAERHQLPRPAMPTATQAVDDNVAWFASVRVSDLLPPIKVDDNWIPALDVNLVASYDPDAGHGSARAEATFVCVDQDGEPLGGALAVLKIAMSSASPSPFFRA